MKTLLSICIFFVGFVLLFLGCGNPDSPPLDWQSGAPDDVSKDIPEDPAFIYASATAESKNEQMAADMAKHDARVKIAQYLETKIGQLLKETENSTSSDGIADDPEEIYLEYTLSKCKATKQEVEQKGPVYQCHVLMKIPLAEAKVALVERVKADVELYLQLKESQGFRKLEEEVEEYKQKE